MRLRVAAVAALVAVVALSGLPGGTATHEGGWCEQDLVTVTIGTGNVGISESLLNGVNHVDIAYPACSGGTFWIDHSSDSVLAENHCGQKFLRVYAPAGAAGAKAVINWQTGSC